MKPFTVFLKSGEKFYLNGAVLRVDRKVGLELLNEATFLMESHVMTPEQTTTPLRQLYFVVQSMMIDPANAPSARMVFETAHAPLVSSFKNAHVLDGLRTVRESVQTGRYFDALKRLRTLFPIEDAILSDPRLPCARPELETGRLTQETHAWTLQ
jgi:flagellar protein FlbT